MIVGEVSLEAAMENDTLSGAGAEPAGGETTTDQRPLNASPVARKVTADRAAIVMFTTTVSPARA